MKNCSAKKHENHPHQHNLDCGHTAIVHNGHIDYVHDGHLHHPHGDHVDEHVLEISATNPQQCTPDHNCHGHDKDHVHGENCGHEAIVHGDHICYIVNGHLHHPHDGHCDYHGEVTIVQKA